MSYKINNLVFEGGGVLGIAYLGALDYLYRNGIMQGIKRVAGTSAGAITACITSFNLPFYEMKRIADTLNYRKVPQKDEHSKSSKISDIVRNEIENIFGDADCFYRLATDYGWYSTQYFYDWIKSQIALQFDITKKLPPYTFADFKNPEIHKDKRPFLDLYIIGTDMSYKASEVFSYETTPNMEVAKAVRISMSIPLFFESIKVKDKNSLTTVFSDGGVMRNYPINIFDAENFKDQIIDGVNVQTLGLRFKNTQKYSEIDSLIEYIKNLFQSLLQVQEDIFNNSPKDIARSIQIETGDVSALDFDISPNDKTYNFLYQQGFDAAKNYFLKQNKL